MIEFILGVPIFLFTLLWIDYEMTHKPGAKKALKFGEGLLCSKPTSNYWSNLL
jgi:hypothetical protein